MAIENWSFDLVHSSINFWVRHLMVSKVHGRFGQWTGSLQLDESNLAASSLDIQIDAASIDTREPQRDTHLRSADFLEAEKYPHLTFKSTAVKVAGKDSFEVQGNLTIRGVTKPVTLEVESSGRVKDPWGGERAGFSAHGSIERKDFGLTWNKALEAGGVVVGDKVEISIEIEAVRKLEAAKAPPEVRA
jgi:polyisoprenoid-binding protein YceI